MPCQSIKSINSYKHNKNELNKNKTPEAAKTVIGRLLHLHVKNVIRQLIFCKLDNDDTPDILRHAHTMPDREIRF